MDCSLLIGKQLSALRPLMRELEGGHSLGHAGHLIAWRELRDRAAAHFQVREQVVLPALRRRGWKGLNSEALAAHVQLKRALAALCICAPGEDQFAQVLRSFSDALGFQERADHQWLVPTLRQLTTTEERRAMCEDIEQLHDALVPPPTHYFDVASAEHPGLSMVEDAAIVLRSLGGEPVAKAP